MADELQVQQGQSSSGAYGLVGGAIGAAGGGFGAEYLTRPKSKYTSHADVIKEAQDSTDFSSKIEKAEGEEKKFLQAAKEVADERGRAEKAWEDEFEAFKKNNTTGVQDTDEIKELVKKQEEYKKTIADLEAKQPAAAEGTVKTVKKDPLGAIRQNTKKLNDAVEELKALKASGAPKESIDAVNRRIKNYETRLENIYQTVVDAKGLKGDEAKALKAELKGYAQDYMAAYDRFSAATPAQGYVVAKQNIAREQKAMEEAIKAFKETSGYDLTSVAGDKKAFFKKANIAIKGEENRLKALEKLLENYNNVSGTTTTSIWDRLAWLITGKNIPEGDDKKAIEEFIKGLSDADKKLLKGKDVTPENLQELINASKEKVKALRTSAAAITHSRASISALETTLADKEKAVVKKYGKGAYINEEGIICKGGKKIGKVPTMTIPEFKPATPVELPKEIDVEIKTSGKKPAVPAELTEARTNLQNVAKEIETKRSALTPKTLSPEEQLAEFAKQKGVKDKAEFVNNQVKEKTEKFGKDFAEQIKRKWGFAEHTNWKIAGAAAVGAVVIGGLASLLAPSKKS